jgi:pantoate--beta-alanine ligase
MDFDATMQPGSIPIHEDTESFRRACDRARSLGQRVGFVPTMGALHDGHLALVREARARSEFVVVSIFVNPTQFGPNEDLAKYPRTFEQDVEGCARAGASCIFAPASSAMYPEGESTRVRVEGLSAPLCGRSRPGHFEGVATIVTKLFALAGPCVAVFGRKDYQQLKVIQRLARDLLFDVDVVGHPTLREPDGLAMSSRNRYLTEDQRRRAAAIPKGLRDAILAFEAGQRRVSALRDAVLEQIQPVADTIDYVDIADADTLVPFLPDEAIPDRAVVALAIRLGPARLIDNIVLGEDPAPTGREV